MKHVIVDANRLFSALISTNSKIRKTLLSSSDIVFVSPKYVFVELFKHKERIIKASKLGELEVLALLKCFIEKIRFFDEESISIGNWVEAPDRRNYFEHPFETSSPRYNNCSAAEFQVCHS